MIRLAVSLVYLSAYFGMGALAHLMYVGATIDPTSAWTYALILGWPFVAALTILAGAVGLILVALLGYLCFTAYTSAAKFSKSHFVASSR